MPNLFTYIDFAKRILFLCLFGLRVAMLHMDAFSDASRDVYVACQVIHAVRIVCSAVTLLRWGERWSCRL